MRIEVKPLVSISSVPVVPCLLLVSNCRSVVLCCKERTVTQQCSTKCVTLSPCLQNLFCLFSCLDGDGSLVSEFIAVGSFRSHKARSLASVDPFRPRVYEIFMKSLSRMDCGTDFFKKARDGILFGGGRLLTGRETGMRKNTLMVFDHLPGILKGRRKAACVCVCVSVCMCVYMQWRSWVSWRPARVGTISVPETAVAN